ncbi:MAG: hypothetical protein DMG75_14985 [Acidobacteria bacterium]|nr:MAG: hypothetical protein DMG75_14985 [Acidobacteriota bacterium]
MPILRLFAPGLRRFPPGFTHARGKNVQALRNKRKSKNGTSLTTHQNCRPESHDCVREISRALSALLHTILLSGISFLELATGAGEGI